MHAGRQVQYEKGVIVMLGGFACIAFNDNKL